MIFLTMDHVLADWTPCYEKYHANRINIDNEYQGWLLIRKLLPINNVINFADYLVSKRIKFYILSSTSSINGIDFYYKVIDEKLKWIEKNIKNVNPSDYLYCPEIIFANAIPEIECAEKILKRKLAKEDKLINSQPEILNAWDKAGGTSIEFQLKNGTETMQNKKYKILNYSSSLVDFKKIILKNQ